MANCTYTIDGKEIKGVEGLKAWLVNGGLESLYPDGSWVQAKEPASTSQEASDAGRVDESIAERIKRRAEEKRPSKPEEIEGKELPTPKEARDFVIEHIRANKINDTTEAEKSATIALKEKYGIKPLDVFGSGNMFRADDFQRAVFKGVYATIRDKGESLPVPVKESDVDREFFRRAYNGTSFSPEERGDSQVEDYIREMVSTYEKLDKLAKTDTQKALLNDLFSDYKAKYIQKLNDYMAAHSRNLSSMITGPARFPTARAEKANRATDNKLNDLIDYNKKAIQRMEKAIVNDGKIPQTPLEQAKQNLASREKSHEIMKAANVIVRDKKLSNEQKIEKLIEVGLSEKNANEILKPDYAGRIGFASYALQNNLAEINRLKQRVKELEVKEQAKVEQQQTGKEEVYTFEGGRVEINRADDRVRIFHDEKPSNDVIALLKRKAFKWSPSNKAWQRQITDNAINAALEITGAKAEQQRFASFDEALNDAERELRSLAKDTEQDGDVLLGNGKFVSFNDALRIVKEGIEEGGLKPVPFQIHDRLDISMRDVDRLLAAANSVKYSKGQSSGSTVEQVKSWLPRNVRKMLDAGKLRVDSLPDSKVEAYYDAANDVIVLNANGLNRNTLNSTLAHELLHRALSKDDKVKAAVDRFNKQMQDSFNRASRGLAGKAENEAYRRVMAAETPAKDRLEEYQSYLVTGYQNNPDSISGAVKKAIQDFIAAIRAFLVRSGLDFGYIQSLTPGDLAALSKFGAKVSNSKPLDSTEFADLAFKPSMAGINAETADKAKLDEALRLDALHRSPESIWRETGWYKGIDGKWRFEIDDSKAKLKPGALDMAKRALTITDDWGTTLGDVFEHDELYKAYPSMPNFVTVRFLKPSEKANYDGYASIGKGEIGIVLREGYQNEHIESILLHEIQHMIQAKEKFANGGDATDATVSTVLRFLQEEASNKFNAKAMRDYREAESELHDLYRLQRYKDLVDYAHRDSITRNSKLFYHHSEYQKHYREVWDEVGYPPKKSNVSKHRSWIQESALYLARRMEQAQAESYAPFLKQSLKNLEQEGGANALKNAIKRAERRLDKTRPVIWAFEEAQKEVNRAKAISEKGISGYFSSSAKNDFYHALAGEVEARMIERRRNLTPEERAELIPTRSEDSYGENKILSPSSNQSVSFSGSDIRYSVGSNVSASPKLKDSILYNLQDRFIDLKNQIEKVVKNGGTISEDSNPYMAEELYHQRTASRIKEFYDKELNPLLKKLHDSGIGLDRFQEFLHARHAPSRNAVMAERNPNQAIIDAKLKDAEESLEAVRNNPASTRKELSEALAEYNKWRRAKPFDGTEEERLSLSGMSNQEARDFLNGLTREEKAVLEPLGDMIDAINEKTLDTQIEYGMETQDSVDALKNQWKHYVPLHRDEAHEDNAFGHPIGRGFSVRGSGMKNATGSNAEVTNILAHIAAAREQMLRRGEKNKVTVALAKFIEQNPDKDFAEINKVDFDKKLNEEGLVESQMEPIFKRNQKDNVVMFRVNGKDQAIVFNEKKPETVRLAMSLKNLDGANLDAVESLIAKGTRWMASVNTQYNIIFGIVNLLRDVQGMMLNLSSTELHGKQRKVFNRLGAAMTTIYNEERGKPSRLSSLYERFNKSGGTTGYTQFFDDIRARNKSIEKEFNKLGQNQAFKIGDAALQWLRDYNTLMENATRFAVFMEAVDSGMSDAKAASLAKNITVNFNRKGAQATKVGAFYAFFNASAQGTARLVETMKGPQGKKIAGGGVLLGAITTLLGMMAMGEDEWEKIPEFVRERSIVIPTGGSNYASIPMPLGFHILPNIGRKLVESAFGSKKVTRSERFLQLVGATANAFNPLGGNGLVDTLSPTVLDPALALMRNQDWTGRQIYREDFSGLNPTPGFTRKKDSASKASTLAAEFINKATGGTDYKQGYFSPTPDQIDYIFGQFFGGTGREALKLDTAVSSLASGEELPLHKIPLVGRLYGETKGNAVERSAYYENIKRMNEHHAEIKGLSKEPNGTMKVRQYLRENPEASLYVKAKAVQRRIDRLNDQRKILVKAGSKTSTIDNQIAAQMKVLNDAINVKING